MTSQAPASHRARHAAPGKRPRRRRGGRAGVVGLAVLAVLVVGGGGAAVGAMTMASSDDTSGVGAPPPVTAQPAAAGNDANGVNGSADAGLPSRPTMLAQVVRIDSGDAVTVEVGGRAMPIRILGIDAPDAAGPGTAAQCGSSEALAFADEQMTGEMVTLVPDPTLPEMDDQGRRMAYVVLHSQLSYTDAALMAGVARADTSRPLWYSDVFGREQAEAADADRGIWGDPCQETPAG